MVTTDTRVTWRPCFHKDVPLLSRAASLFAGVRAGGGTELHLRGVPSSAVAVYFFLLELCDAASCSVLCGAIRIAQQRSVTGQQLREGSACFWEVTEASFAWLFKGCGLGGGGKMYLGLLQPCLLLGQTISSFWHPFLIFSLFCSPMLLFNTAPIVLAI